MAEVVLQVYDLTGGMAKMMSLPLLGKQVDGIWHTSVVIFGREYYFGGGICSDIPLNTPYGTPVERIPMGTSSRTQSDFTRFLQCVSHRFTMDSYHIVEHNCNNFTDECMRFLVDKGIPAHITGLPADLLATPLGQQFAPMINSMMNMKTQMFGEAEANVDHFADYANHDMYFAGKNKVDNYKAYDGVAKGTGVLVYWDPRNDESLELVEIVEQLRVPVAFCDVLRCFYLAPQAVPSVRLFVHGELINDYSVNEFKESIGDIHEMAGV